MRAQVEEYLRRQDTTAIKCGDVASHFCRSKTHFSRLLRQEGVTFYELLDEERQRRCRELLLTQPCTSLCKRVGNVLGISQYQAGRLLRKWHGGARALRVTGHP